jgi:hypothetical protein
VVTLPTYPSCCCSYTAIPSPVISHRRICCVANGAQGVAYIFSYLRSWPVSSDLNHPFGRHGLIRSVLQVLSSIRDFYELINRQLPSL